MKYYALFDKAPFFLPVVAEHTYIHAVDRVDLFYGKNTETKFVKPIGVYTSEFYEFMMDTDIGDGSFVINEGVKNILEKYNIDNLKFYEIAVFVGKEQQNWKEFSQISDKFYYVTIQKYDYLSEINFQMSRFLLGPSYKREDEHLAIEVRDLEDLKRISRENSDMNITAKKLFIHDSSMKFDIINFNLNGLNFYHFRNPLGISERLKEILSLHNVSGIDRYSSEFVCEIFDKL
ncbi:hypothetical protein [Flectobacillus sp. BAB-3569]|uniref:hypothetical protein n=1 Tax=Flectobacillus sp. BAB-3569 TaxID=1509483 RepID=UPI000BA3E98A|nr:hypothetical protein [Flectobacillus sp. BAB-3569]PAC30313.1 hypothetical protein BWI92_12455 [Flectobacillus sp. BAB-3569]